MVDTRRRMRYAIPEPSPAVKASLSAWRWRWRCPILVSHKTRIDSLFLDEGFGTLDSETLDTALDALDALECQR